MAQHEAAALSMRTVRTRIALALVMLAAMPAAAQVTLTEGTNFAVDVAADGRLAMDLLGSIWVLPSNGGNAEPLATGLLSVAHPRWSPDGDAILFVARAEGRNELGIYRFASDDVQRLGDGRYSNQHAEWHPDGERVVFSSQRHDRGLDLWELDIPTGLVWRISDRPGDETEPTWSADGRHLLYVNEFDGQWSLILRRFGEPDRILISSGEQLSAPSWRPDGSLVTFTRHSEVGIVTNMLIFSDPLLERTLIDETDLFVTPVAWLDRQRMFYAANGVIRERRFDSWNPRTVCGRTGFSTGWAAAIAKASTSSSIAGSSAPSRNGATGRVRSCSTWET
jgi:dipeptidyl aminopeptidase/acylaminoacyl peptidase